MKTKVILSVAGLAACGAADAQVRPEIQQLNNSGRVFQAVRATAITGLTVDGQYVYGKTIELGQNSSTRGGLTTAYDSQLMADTDGDGQDLDPVCADLAPHGLTTPGSRYFFGTEFSFQSQAEDIVPASGTEGQMISEVVMSGTRPLCDNGTGTTSEVMQQVITSWEVIDNFPDLDGTDGFATATAGLVTPFDQNDTDGDTFVDEFNGGMILTYADTDTDGDGANDEQLSAGASGYGIYFGTGLETLGVPMPSGVDRYDGSGGAPDGRPDGGIQVEWTRGDGGDAMGPLLGGFYPSTRASSMFWGTAAMEPAGSTCPYIANPGFGAGDSDGIVWGEGQDLCNDVNNAGGDWSTGGPAGNATVDNLLDPDFDVADWFGIVPDFDRLGLAVRLKTGASNPGTDCCDVNGDGACSPTDFSAWINAFNNSLPTCDVNQDGACSPTDFSAWISAFNDSSAGNPQTCIF
jgi:hypothetical protein